MARFTVPEEPRAASVTPERHAAPCYRFIVRREILLEHLSIVAGHVLAGEDILSRQTELVHRLEAAGRDSGLARALLQQYRECQKGTRRSSRPADEVACLCA